MKKILPAIILVVSMFALAACEAEKKEKPSETSPSVAQADLVHHKFELLTANGKAIESERPVSIEFNEGLNVSGRICNQFVGQGELIEGKLVVKNMASTKMLCISEELNKLEGQFGLLLNDGASITLKDNELTLSGKDLTLVYTLKDLVN